MPLDHIRGNGESSCRILWSRFESIVSQQVFRLRIESEVPRAQPSDCSLLSSISSSEENGHYDPVQEDNMQRNTNALELERQPLCDVHKNALMLESQLHQYINPTLVTTMNRRIAKATFEAELMCKLIDKLRKESRQSATDSDRRKRVCELTMKLKTLLCRQKCEWQCVGRLKETLSMAKDLKSVLKFICQLSCLLEHCSNISRSMTECPPPPYECNSPFESSSSVPISSDESCNMLDNHIPQCLPSQSSMTISVSVDLNSDKKSCERSFSPEMTETPCTETETRTSDSRLGRSRSISRCRDTGRRRKPAKSDSEATVNDERVKKCREQFSRCMRKQTRSNSRLTRSASSHSGLDTHEMKSHPDSTMQEGRSHPNSNMQEGRSHPNSSMQEGRSHPDSSTQLGRSHPDSTQEGRSHPDSSKISDSENKSRFLSDQSSVEDDTYPDFQSKSSLYPRSRSGRRSSGTLDSTLTSDALEEETLDELIDVLQDYLEKRKEFLNNSMLPRPTLKTAPSTLIPPYLINPNPHLPPATSDTQSVTKPRGQYVPQPDIKSDLYSTTDMYSESTSFPSDRNFNEAKINKSIPDDSKGNLIEPDQIRFNTTRSRWTNSMHVGDLNKIDTNKGNLGNAKINQSSNKSVKSSDKNGKKQLAVECAKVVRQRISHTCSPARPGRRSNVCAGSYSSTSPPRAIRQARSERNSISVGDESGNSKSDSNCVWITAEIRDCPKNKIGTCAQPILSDISESRDISSAGRKCEKYESDNLNDKKRRQTGSQRCSRLSSKQRTLTEKGRIKRSTSQSSINSESSKFYLRPRCDGSESSGSREPLLFSSQENEISDAKQGKRQAFQRKSTKQQRRDKCFTSDILELEDTTTTTDSCVIVKETATYSQKSCSKRRGQRSKSYCRDDTEDDIEKEVDLEDEIRAPSRGFSPKRGRDAECFRRCMEQSSCYQPTDFMSKRPAYERVDCSQYKDRSPCGRFMAPRQDNICSNILSAMRQSQFYDCVNKSPIYPHQSLVSARKSPASVHSSMHHSASIAGDSYAAEEQTRRSMSPIQSNLQGNISSSTHYTVSSKKSTSKPASYLSVESEHEYKSPSQGKPSPTGSFPDESAATTRILSQIRQSLVMLEQRALSPSEETEHPALTPALSLPWTKTPASLPPSEESETSLASSEHPSPTPAQSLPKTRTQTSLASSEHPSPTPAQSLPKTRTRTSLAPSEYLSPAPAQSLPKTRTPVSLPPEEEAEQPALTPAPSLPKTRTRISLPPSDHPSPTPAQSLPKTRTRTSLAPSEHQSPTPAQSLPKTRTQTSLPPSEYQSPKPAQSLPRTKTQANLPEPEEEEQTLSTQIQEDTAEQPEEVEEQELPSEHIEPAPSQHSKIASKRPSIASGSKSPPIASGSKTPSIASGSKSRPITPYKSKLSISSPASEAQIEDEEDITSRQSPIPESIREQSSRHTVESRHTPAPSERMSAARSRSTIPMRQASPRREESAPPEEYNHEDSASPDYEGEDEQRIGSLGDFLKKRWWTVLPLFLLLLIILYYVICNLAKVHACVTCRAPFPNIFFYFTNMAAHSVSLYHYEPAPV